MKYKRAYIIEIVELLRETTSKNEKIEILKRAIAETPYFKEYLVATFDPSIKYYIRSAPAYKPLCGPGIKNFGAIFKHGLLTVLSDRKKTGAEAIKYLQALLEDMEASNAAALVLLINRDLNCGTSIGLINRARPNLIPKYPCMLCHQYSTELLDTFAMPAIAQIKADGLRCNISIKKYSVALRSRLGKMLGDDLDEIFGFLIDDSRFDALRGYVLDGELQVTSPTDTTKFLSRKISNGIINRAKKGNLSDTEKAQVVFVVWDIIPQDKFTAGGSYDIPYAYRYNSLKKFFTSDTNPIRLIESMVVNNKIEVLEYFKTATGARGLEGIVLKDPMAPWVDNRTKSQLKFKLNLECDLKIVGFNAGTGKNKNRLGSLQLSTADDLLQVAAGSGLSDTQRKEYWDDRENLIGKIVATKYNELISNDEGRPTLFLPIFVEIRTDKVTANTLDELE